MMEFSDEELAKYAEKFADHDFNYRPSHARRRCMSFGLRIATLWTISFLMVMQGMRSSGLMSTLVGNLGLAVGVLSIYRAGILIRLFNKVYKRGPLLRTWWMVFLTLFCGTLVFALVQFLWFLFFDGGSLAQQMEIAMETPAYQQMTQGLTEADIKAAVEAFSNPRELTCRFFLMNIIISFIGSIPATIVGHTKTDVKF